MKLKTAFIRIVTAALFTLAVMRAAFDIPLESLLLIYATAGVVFIAAAMIINIRRTRKFLKDIDGLTTILIDEKNPDKYIAENEKRLEYKNPERFRSVVLCNIAAGYCEKKDFQTAQKKLMEIREDKLSGIYELMCFMNRAYVFFYLGDYARAMSIMDKYGQKLNQIKSNIKIEPIVTVLNIFEQIAENNEEKANELLFVAEEKWSGTAIDDDLKYLKMLLYRPSREY